MTRFGLTLLSVAAGLDCIEPAQADQLSHIDTYEWTSKSFVGLSGLEVSADGGTYYAVSDQGWYLTGELTRSEGVIVDIGIARFLPIQGNDGLPVAARRLGDWSDAEGLARAADGRLWISFERWAHVSRFGGEGQTGEWIKDHSDFSQFADNKQLEALALHPDDTVYTFPEEPLEAGFPIFKLESNTWDISGYIVQDEGFSIVGADFDTEGVLYLLERKHVLGAFLQSRVRRLSVDAPQQAEVLWTSPRDAYGNLEGIAVWSDAEGTRLTMVSDNNGDRLGVTQFVEFRVCAVVCD